MLAQSQNQNLNNFVKFLTHTTMPEYKQKNTLNRLETLIKICSFVCIKKGSDVMMHHRSVSNTWI